MEKLAEPVEDNCFKLGDSRGANPVESSTCESGGVQLSEYARVRSVGGEEGKKVRGLPMKSGDEQLD